MAEAAWRRRFRAPRSGFPTWARDAADRLVYLSNAGGKFEVYAWDRSREAHRQVTDRAEGTGYRVSTRLAPDGEEIWWWDDRKGDEHGTWIAERFESGERRNAATLEPSYSAGLAVGRRVAAIGRSSATEGSTVDLVPHRDRPLRIYQHRESASVGALSTDETLFALAHAEHGDSRNRAVRILDLAGNAVRDLWDGPDRGLDPLRWSPRPGDQRLIIQHERTGTARPMVYSVAGGTERQVEVDLPGEVFALDWFADASALLLEHEHRGRSELYRYDLATSRLERVPTEPGSLDAARVRPDGEIWYQLNGSAEPPSTRSRGRTVMRPPGETAPPGVAYTDHDVRGIHVFVAEPRSSRPHPAFFLVHGGPEAHDRDAWSPAVQAWVDHGFAVVLVNYRGSSGYGKAWRDAIKGKPGVTELEDIAAVHDWAIAGGLADRTRCVIGGGSWGGYLTLLGLGTQPERWALGIASVPIGDYVAAFEDEMEPLKRYDEALFGGSPSEIPEVYRERNPITYVERVRVPMLILVGQNDPRCPARGVDVYVDRLRELGKPHDVYRYDAGHGSLVIEEQIRQAEAQIAFAAKHLGTTAPIA